MTNIIDMAREAGFVSAAYWPNEFRGLHDCVERFATIHRAAIIAELCAGVEMPEPVGACVDDTGYAYLKWKDGARLLVGTSLYTLDQMREYGAACAARERELCAKVCDELHGHRNDECAAAIRARGAV